MYRETDLSEEKNRILRAMGKVKDTELLNQVLDLSISPEVRNQDTIIVLSSASSTKIGRDKVWALFKNNMKLFQERYSSFVMTRYVKVCEIIGKEMKLISCREIRPFRRILSRKKKHKKLRISFQATHFLEPKGLFSRPSSRSESIASG